MEMEFRLLSRHHVQSQRCDHHSLIVASSVLLETAFATFIKIKLTAVCHFLLLINLDGDFVWSKVLILFLACAFQSTEVFQQKAYLGLGTDFLRHTLKKKEIQNAADIYMPLKALSPPAFFHFFMCSCLYKLLCENHPEGQKAVQQT